MDHEQEMKPHHTGAYWESLLYFPEYVRTHEDIENPNLNEKLVADVKDMLLKQDVMHSDLHCKLRLIRS